MNEERKNLIEKLEQALFLLDEIVRHPEHRGLIGAQRARLQIEEDITRLEEGNTPRLAGAFLRNGFTDKQ
jgi:hypothetical protein